jgi:hypothetical protein
MKELQVSTFRDRRVRSFGSESVTQGRRLDVALGRFHRHADPDCGVRYWDVAEQACAIGPCEAQGSRPGSMRVVATRMVPFLVPTRRLGFGLSRVLQRAESRTEPPVAASGVAARRLEGSGRRRLPAKATACAGREAGVHPLSLRSRWERRKAPALVTAASPSSRMAANAWETCGTRGVTSRVASTSAAAARAASLTASSSRISCEPT